MSTPDAGLTRGFMRRTGFQFAVAAMLFLAWQLADVLLLAFGAVVVAAVLRALSDPIARRTPMGDKASLAAAVLIILAVFAGAGWLFGSTVSRQVEVLVERLPRSPSDLQVALRTLPLGALLAEQVGELGGFLAGFQGVAGRVGGYAVNALSAAANLLLVLVAGAASLALAGCGGGSTPAANSATDAGNAASATTTTTTAAAGAIPATCQAYLDAVQQCVDRISAQNPAAAAQVRQQLDQTRAQWSSISDQAALSSACTTATNAWNSMKGAMGCG